MSLAMIRKLRGTKVSTCRHVMLSRYKVAKSAKVLAARRREMFVHDRGKIIFRGIPLTVLCIPERKTENRAKISHRCDTEYLLAYYVILMQKPFPSHFVSAILRLRMEQFRLRIRVRQSKLCKNRLTNRFFLSLHF